PHAGPLQPSQGPVNVLGSPRGRHRQGHDQIPGRASALRAAANVARSAAMTGRPVPASKPWFQPTTLKASGCSPTVGDNSPAGFRRLQAAARAELAGTTVKGQGDLAPTGSCATALAGTGNLAPCAK